MKGKNKSGKTKDHRQKKITTYETFGVGFKLKSIGKRPYGGVATSLVDHLGHQCSEKMTVSGTNDGKTGTKVSRGSCRKT